MNTSTSAPESILIIGAGVFGLSTALALLARRQYDSTQITIIDSADTLPNPVGSSVDASRIVRADYGHSTYAKLACLAQEHWRDQSPSGWGGEGRYTETGFILTGDKGQEDYVRKSMLNVQDLARQGLPMDITKIQELRTKDEIRSASKLPGVSGDNGYANWNSGWADAEACIAHALSRISSHTNNRGRVTVKPAHKVSRLLFDPSTHQCTGVECTNGTTLTASLTILATGAWTPCLINLQNRALATGQVLAYLKITSEEQDYLEKTPVVINFARGTFVIPPRNCELKIARHGYGYRNPVDTPTDTSKTSISVPRTDTQIPTEAQSALREALAELFPPSLPVSSFPQNCPSSLCTISTRPFTHTRICWYTDTPAGNFLIDYPPLSISSGESNKSLFVATGGSGHGFKFLPVLGDKIVDAVEGKLEDEYAKLWAWPSDEMLAREHKISGGDGCDRVDAGGKPLLETFLECNDGSRGGPRGMILADELAKSDGSCK